MPKDFKEHKAGTCSKSPEETFRPVYADIKNSGFNEKFRKDLLDSAFKAFEKMKVDDQTGKKPMYRSRSWNFEERSRKK